MSKVVISTNTLKDLVSRAIKVCHSVEYGLDGLMELKVENNTLFITTSDNSYTMVLKAPNVESENFKTVVNAKFFAQLTNKITTTNIGLELKDNALVIEGNGIYTIPVVNDSDGSAISFPEITFDTNAPIVTVDKSSLKSVLTLNKSCKGKTRIIQQYYDYYMDNEKVITFSDNEACINPVKLFNEPVLITPELLDLVPAIEGANGVNVQKSDKNIMFSSEIGNLYGVADLDYDVTEFEADKITEALAVDFKYTAKLNRTQLMNALDRICLFTQALGSNNVNVTFTNTGMVLRSDSAKSEEEVKYLQPIENVEPLNIKLDGTTLKELINSCNREDITINFGSETELQLICDNVKQAMSFFEPDEEIEIG